MWKLLKLDPFFFEFFFGIYRYLSIVKEEGLEISQPGLDPAKSEMHHLITVRKRNSIVHR